MHINPIPGQSLLDLLRKEGVYVAAPCGGRGICRKCSVEVAGMGHVLACRCFPVESVEVTVRAPSAMQVLTESFWPDPEPAPDILAEGETPGLGVAVDLGTTTLVVFLEEIGGHRNIGVRSLPNPQQAYGADVVSRIHYVTEHPGATAILCREIVEAIESAVLGLCREFSLDPLTIGRMAVAGNPTMLHLFRGDNPESLAQYPFTPVFLDEQLAFGSSLGFRVLTEMQVTLLPSVSAYVGADITGGLASVAWNRPDGWSLFLDIGTNGEMALFNNRQILACATAAGPAFEGARISCGVPGIAGAVCAFRGEGFETIGNKPPIGLCGSGLVDGVALLLERGAIDMMGYMEPGSGKLPGGLELTPQDIREVQLAKGAIAAGIRVLLSEAGITAGEVDRVFMAGGFGYALNDWSAGRIGLLPDGLENRQIRAGNTSGLGARLWLHSGEFRTFTRELVKTVTYVGLSEHPGFNDHFVWEMTFNA